VEFDVSLVGHTISLPADHYFFVPQVGLSATAPANAHFLWLSTPKPIVPPGTPFPPGATDLQSWMRDDPPLAPDWLRIGTDIIKAGAPPTFLTFNAAFSLSGTSAGSSPAAPASNSAAPGSGDVIVNIDPLDPGHGHHRGPWTR
jgi:hypothetical protein